MTATEVKSDEVMRHDRAVGWSLSLVAAVTVLAAVVALLRRLSRKVALERAERAIDEAYTEYDR